MHLVRGMTSLNQKKRKSQKKTQRQIKLEAEHNEYLKRLGVGKVKLPVNKKGERIGLNEIPNYKAESNTSTSDTIPANGPAKGYNKYTGDLIVGIGTMHKSNAVPIMRGTNEAKEIAKMRR